MATKDSSLIHYNDGEGLNFDDLNDAQKAHTQRSWEWPGYADLLAHSQVVVGPNYETCFDLANGLRNMVFCKGAGPGLYPSGLTVTVGSGFLGVFDGEESPVALDPKMAWVYVNSGNQSFTHVTAPAGQKRYDVLTLAITEIDGDPQPRDFEDSVTGAKTTTTPNKHRTLTGTFNLTQGTPDADPVPPVMGAPNHVLALVLVNDTAVETVHDCMMPFGPVQSHLTWPGLDSKYNAQPLIPNWKDHPDAPGSTGDRTRLTCVSDVGVGDDQPHAYLFPRAFAGDATARLIGVELDFSPFAGTVQLCALSDGAVVDLEDITALFTTSPRIDLRGYPFVLSGRRGPFWGHGGRAKVSQLSDMSGTTIGLHITGISGNILKSVRWHFVKG